VVVLLHMPLRMERVDRRRPAADTNAPRQVVIYMTLSPVNRGALAIHRQTEPPHPAPTTNGVSQSDRRLLTQAVGSPTDGFRAAESSTEVPATRFREFNRNHASRPQAEVIDSIIRRSIQPGNDSMARVRHALRTAVDWTITVRGDRYGMSPGALHLGRVDVRFPLVFAEPLSFSSDRRRESRLVNEDTRAQAARAARHAAFDSSVASIRARLGDRPD
jgi:hypothetical protein